MHSRFFFFNQLKALILHITHSLSLSLDLLYLSYTLLDSFHRKWLHSEKEPELQSPFLPRPDPGKDPDRSEKKRRKKTTAICVVRNAGRVNNPRSFCYATNATVDSTYSVSGRFLLLCPKAAGSAHLVLITKIYQVC